MTVLTPQQMAALVARRSGASVDEVQAGTSPEWLAAWTSGAAG
jgi:hypothetical protein